MQENGKTKTRRVVPPSHHSRGKVQRECDLEGRLVGVLRSYQRGF